MNISAKVVTSSVTCTGQDERSLDVQSKCCRVGGAGWGGAYPDHVALLEGWRVDANTVGLSEKIREGEY